jgi:hypothetical protein
MVSVNDFKKNGVVKGTKNSRDLFLKKSRNKS